MRGTHACFFQATQFAGRAIEPTHVAPDHTGDFAFGQTNIVITSVAGSPDHTEVYFSVNTTEWKRNCSHKGAEADAWYKHTDCDADDASYNVYYSVANSDVFTVRFFEEAAIRRVHLPPPAMNDSMPEYENTQIIGEVLPGGSASSVEDQQKCLALLVLVCILWATDAIPLWVTSLLIPLIVVLDNIILGAETDSGHFVPVPAQKTATAQLANLANPNVILLMGGFSMAAALHKFDLDSRLAMAILSRSGDNPRVFILINMVVGFVISMFCNNVAAPVLCFFLVSPVLQRVSKEDRSYCQCMIMSIAFACNIGGMPTPIASPQNTAALLAINQQVPCPPPAHASLLLSALFSGLVGLTQCARAVHPHVGSRARVKVLSSLSWCIAGQGRPVLHVGVLHDALLLSHAFRHVALPACILETNAQGPP